MRMRPLSLLACGLAAACVAACSSTPSTGNPQERALVHSQSMDAMSRFIQRDASLQSRIDSAYAYAIFPDVTVAAVGVGGGHGRGEVYQNRTLIGYADVSQGNIGLQLGAQSFAELILFENQATLLDFQNNTFQFDAKATAVAAENGAGAKADYNHGVLAFGLPQGGLMFQAAIGGEKFRYIPSSEVDGRYYDNPPVRSDRP